MQSVSSRIWTRVAVSISYDDNVYTTGRIVMITNSGRNKEVHAFFLRYLTENKRNGAIEI